MKYEANIKACKGKNKATNFMVTLELMQRNNYFHGVMFCDFNVSYEVTPSIEFIIKLTALQQVIKILSLLQMLKVFGLKAVQLDCPCCLPECLNLYN